MDSGISAANPDLLHALDIGLCQDFTSGVANPVDVPIDDNGHGTFVAGIIGAVGNNDIGITGVCWKVNLVSLKILDSAGRGYSSYAAAAIDFAELKSIPIINFSANWKSESLESHYDCALDESIENYSGLFVNSAGNVGLNNDYYETYPANYELANKIVVGASNSADRIATFSNYGKNSVDIFAPGEDVSL